MEQTFAVVTSAEAATAISNDVRVASIIISLHLSTRLFQGLEYG